MAENEDTPTTPAPEAPPKRRRAPSGTRLMRRFISPTVAIAIDQETIDASIQRDSSHCMIAEAIKKAAPNMKNVQVDLGSIAFSDPVKRLRYTYLTPRAGQIALIEFDRGIRPGPFSFTLKTATKVTRGKAGGGRKLTDEQRAESRERRLTTYRHNRELRRQRHAQSSAEVFEPSPEAVDAVLRAAADPQADLGPAMAVPAPGTRHPVIVGGLPPASQGNLAKTRRFGIRQYLE
jgi:hypothetical protein